MPTISFEEGLGLAAPAAEGKPAVAATGKTLSFEDGLGLPPPAAEQPSLGGFLRDPESWKGVGNTLLEAGAKGAGFLGILPSHMANAKALKEAPAALLGTAAQASDMGTGALKSVLGVAPYWAANASALATTGDKKLAAQVGQMAKEEMLPATIFAPWSVVAESLGPTAKYAYENNPIAWAMGKIGEISQVGADKIADKSGIPAEHLMELLDQTMGSMMASGMKPGIKKALESRIEQFKNRGTAEAAPPGEAPAAETPAADEPVAPPQRPGPDVMVMEKKAQVKKLFDDAKRETSPLNVPDAAAVSDMFDRVRRGDPAPDAGTERAAATSQVPPPIEPLAKTRLQDPTIIGEQPSNLDTAREKLVDGKGFDMSAEEVLALKKAGQERRPLVDQYGKPLALGALALGALSTMDLSDEERVGLGIGMGMTVGLKGQRGGEIPLGFSAADLHPYAFPSLDSIAKGATEVAKTKIEARLKNEAVPEVERAIIKRVLATEPGDTISTRKLVDGVKEETSGFKLEPKETGQYADYGLERIDRPEADTWGPPDFDEGFLEPHPLGAKTTLYKLPEMSAASDANHFREPDLFGWTRSFREDGKRHVVELQSDLAQHAKEIPEAKLQKIVKDAESVTQQLKLIDKHTNAHEGVKALPLAVEQLDKLNPDASILLADKIATSPFGHGLLKTVASAGSPLEYIKYITDIAEGKVDDLHTTRGAAKVALANAAMDYRNNLVMLQHEHAATLASGAVSSQLSPVLKNWPRRLIREELRQEALEGGDSVRFATADTVAKVEGWPRESLKHLQETVEYNKNRLDQAYTQQRLAKDLPSELAQQGRAADVKLAKERVAEAETAVARFDPKSPNIEDPGHQSIYDRYAGPITRYLKGLGGKEVTDAEGHTWIETPTKSVLHDTPKGPAIKMLGSADQKVMAVMAAAGIGGAVAIQDPALGLGLAAAGLGIIGTGRLAGRNLIDTFRAGNAADAPRTAKLERDLAASQLYEANAGTLKRALRSFESKGLDIEELVQRTLMKGFASLDKPADAPGGFRGDSKFSSFLFGNAQNLAKDAWRSAERGLKTEDLTPELVDRAYGHSATPEKAALNKALTEKLVAAIERLPDKLREPFEMAELEGLTDIEIGERLGIDRAAARKAIYNARQELRQSLRAYSDKESGFADPKTLAGIAALAGGAALGAYLNPEHPLVGGLYGAGAGVLLMNARPAKWVEAYKRARLDGPLVDVSDQINQNAYAIKVGMRAVQQVLWEVEKVAPTLARREAIRDYLVGEKSVVLTPEEKVAAAKIREFYDAQGKVATDAGVVDKMVADYVTRQWEGGAPGTKLVGNNMTQSSPFGKPRGYRTEAEAEAAGLRLKTKDISQVLQDYSGSINRAIANKQLVEVLKQGSMPEGTRFLAKEGKAPDDYVRVESPQLKGWLAHPDIVPDLKHVFSLKDPGAVIGALDALNATQKRMAVMTSMFHPMALEHALIGAMPVLKSPLLGAKAFGQSFAPMIFGESAVIRQLREGGVGDSIDKLMKGGLEFSIEREGKATSTEDASQSMYKGLDMMSKMMDEAVPGLGKQTLGRMSELNHLFDRAMWGRFHTTLKIMVAEAKASDLLRNNSRDIKSLMSEAEAYKQASSFTNDLFGGLNWYGVASEFKSRLGRELVMSATSPMGRLGMRLVLFAPDWTLSTTRAFIKAFGPMGVAAGVGAVAGSQLVTDDFSSKLMGGGLGAVLGFGAGKALGLKGVEGSGFRGMLPEEFGGKAMNITDLHRQYIVRSALIYTLVADSANYAMSGHHLWDNKDPTRIDKGDGQTIVASKHFMEPFHWGLDPKKQAMGKTSFLIKESAAQITDKEYWSATGAPRLGGKIFDENGFPVKKDITLGQRAQHVAKQFVPISLQGVENATPQSLGLNALGMPVYGKSDAMKAAEREAITARTSTPEYKAEKQRRAIQSRIDRRDREASK